MVAVVGSKRHAGVEHLVIRRPDRTLALVPAWMGCTRLSRSMFSSDDAFRLPDDSLVLRGGDAYVPMVHQGRREVILQDAVSAQIAERPHLTQQHCRRNPIRRGGLYSLADVMLVGVELARSRFTRVARQPFAPQIASHRVARHV